MSNENASQGLEGRVEYIVPAEIRRRFQALVLDSGLSPSKYFQQLVEQQEAIRKGYEDGCRTYLIKNGKVVLKLPGPRYDKKEALLLVSPESQEPSREIRLAK